jgi:hypothetical protein
MDESTTVGTDDTKVNDFEQERSFANNNIVGTRNDALVWDMGRAGDDKISGNDAHSSLNKRLFS